MSRVRHFGAARRLSLPLAICLGLLAIAVPTPAAAAVAETGGATAGAVLDPTPNPWRLGDSLGARMEPLWNPKRGLYMNQKGFADTRLNSLMLQLHGMAALAGHQGPIRRDERLAPIASVLTAAPVLVSVNLKPRTTGHFPHAPAWTSAIGENPEQANLHPSLDVAAVRGLLSAWRARDVVGMSPELSARIASVFLQTAQSPFYRAPSRALNQINWHTEVYGAAFETTGNPSVLADYRAQLLWFAQYAHKTDKKNFPGGSPNLTSGGGFRYLPNRKANAQLNRIESTEYGNLALSSLGWYNAALRAGMPRLPKTHERTLQQWAKHMLLGSWTHAGYPNWDSGLGTKRRHLRQYWAWSLDGLMAASGPDALLGYTGQRAYARSIVGRGISLYLKTAWLPEMDAITGPLPGKTSFSAPNGFTSGSGNELIGPLRFAVLNAQLDGRFQDVAEKAPPSWYSHDKETGRLAFSTPYYNGAILPTRAGQSQGGIEPVRIFDGEQRPLTTLGGRGTGSLGVAIVKGGTVRVDTQPATPGRQKTRDVKLDGRKPDSASAFTKPIEVTASVEAADGRISARHRLSGSGIRTTFSFSKVHKKARISFRIPVWGADAKLAISSGAIRRGGTWQRTGGTIVFNATTNGGARMQVQLAGVPKKAEMAFVTVRPDSYRPIGAHELVVVFAAPESGKARITRQLTVQRAR